MPYEPDHVLLRRYHEERDRGELEMAAQTWERLVVNNFDRIKQSVKAFRFSAGSRGLPHPEWGSAASEAYLRVIAMGANFRKPEIGRFYAALAKCVHNACMDYGRKDLRHERHSAGSVDARFDPDGEAGPYDAALAAYDGELRARSSDAVEDELDKQDAARMVAWGIGQMTNDKHREVLEMTYIKKLPAEESAQQLGITMDNIYQRRRRGVLELEKILRDSRA
jgi:RNA polymerase sigma factor (sigma-70 family)